MCHAFQERSRHSVIHILTDSITTVYYVNRQGRAYSRLLCLEVINQWQFCIKEDITLIAIHLAGVWNCLADHVSRFFSPLHKWSLKAKVLQMVFAA